MSTKSNAPGGAIVDNRQSPHCRMRGAPLQAVKWAGGFWRQRFEQCKDVTIPHLWKRLSDPDTGHALQNLRIYAGLEKGEFQGTAWQDEWVHKWLEAAAYVYAYTGDKALDKRMDEVIEVIAKAQEPDGYIASQILRYKERYLRPGNHELYVMGHMLTAACAHHRATGKTNFLAVARKCGDYLHKTFTPRPPELAHFGINPSYIMGCVELYRTTGEKKYLDVANVFIDMRGSAPGGTDLNQTHVPLRKETHVVGHAVFWTYLYAGAADAYMETGDPTLLDAVNRLWDDLMERKLYVNGGVCAVHRGLSIRFDDVHEAAGAEYDLPSSTAYNETCSQIGNFLWNWRMLMINGEARHGDVMELNLYNTIISGIGLDGASWFYTNPLRWHGQGHPLLSQDAYQRFQPGEPPQRHHICCPSNLVRTIAGLHGYLYSLNDEGVCVTLYGASRFDGALLDGARLSFTQETDYPWDGHIAIAIEQAPTKAFAIQLRIPEWASDATVKVNGQAQK
ncbi:MAG: glycoside hydrolase family 127 protein, partial [Candidatus Sumerlaeota bacterium]|nr:glycoside hydrolase family 127 protein [Candidatus Sumerlaeota bacterium]